MDRRNTTELRAEVFGTAFVVMQHLTTRMDRALVPLELTSRQWLLLAVLDTAFRGTAPTLSETAAVYGTSRQNVRKVADQLQARGWLVLEQDPDDRRAVRLHLTDRIAEFARPEVQRLARTTLSDAFAGLTTAQLRQLRDLVTAWRDALLDDE